MSISSRRLASFLAPVVLACLFLLSASCGKVGLPGNGEEGGAVSAQPADGYLFCFWNVENLFDDKLDGYKHQPDKHYDEEFTKPGLLDEKLGKLSKVLLSMNGGRGPDILAVAEVENERAADLLQQRLNKDLGSKAEPYRNLLFKENKPGRHIATAILTRLPVRADRTHKLDERHRILEGHIEVNGHQLVVIASHWTSRVSDHAGKEGGGRAKYADLLYGRFKAMFLANRDIDLLICGDFNDTPENVSVTDHLHATGKRSLVRKDTRDPRLFNLSAGRDSEKFGTHRYERKWFLFDQIVVSPGLLDNKGWTVVPETLQTVRHLSMQTRFGGPWSFDRTYEDRSIKDGGKRGVADHFPVTVRLKVQK